MSKLKHKFSRTKIRLWEGGTSSSPKMGMNVRGNWFFPPLVGDPVGGEKKKNKNKTKQKTCTGVHYTMFHTFFIKSSSCLFSSCFRFSSSALLSLIACWVASSSSPLPKGSRSSSESSILGLLCLNWKGVLASNFGELNWTYNYCELISYVSCYNTAIFYVNMYSYTPHLT